MGADFSNRWILFGEAAAPPGPLAVADRICAILRRAGLLLPDVEVDTLRAAWRQGARATEILGRTAQLFGWDPALVRVGFTYDDEGVPIRYDEYLREDGVDLQGFREHGFRTAAPRESPTP